MIFKQLFDEESCTYTYLIACEDTGQCALIDTVLKQTERDLSVLASLGLTLNYTIDTHLHADHLTGAAKLKSVVYSKVVYPKMCELPCMDLGVEEGTPFKIGNIELHPLFTPGHTDHHFSYLLKNNMQSLVFSGDALLIEACGRTDFQSGNAVELYENLHAKIFSLPDETLIYPGHDYEGRQVSSVGQEKVRNPRLKQGTTLDEFVSIMKNLNLPYPKKIDFAVPGNELCGICPENTPEKFRGPCDFFDQG